MNFQRGKVVVEQRSVANKLLKSLSSTDWDLLAPSLERVELRSRQILHHAKMPMDQVYFIEKALVSVSARIAPDQWVEVWLIGSEGMTGVPVMLGNPQEPALRRMVQIGGDAYRLPSRDLLRAVGASRTLEGVLLRYVEVVLLQTSQSGACNSHHNVTQRLARWLLLARDCLEDDKIPLTHTVLARLLGVRRPSVTDRLGVLQEEGAIRLSRGCVEIVDQAPLEAASCHCLQVIRHEYKRLIEAHRASPSTMRP